MKLNQTTYRLYLRTEINQTGYTPAPSAINAAITAIAALDLASQKNSIDKQD